MTKLMKMARAEYDRLDRVNWSSLKHLARSPAHYRHALLQQPTDTDAMKRGRAVHLAVFEPERFRTECVVWDGGTRRGKEWEAFCQEHRGLEVLTMGMYEEALAIGAAARADKEAARLLSKGRAEQTMLWTHRGFPSAIQAKGRVDFIADLGLVDLKTTKDASPVEFGRQAARLEYCCQAAYYRDGYEAITGERPPYFVVAAESLEPYVVQVYEVQDDLLELGRAKYRELLVLLQECKGANDWPGYGQGAQALCLPRWAVPDEESDIGALGLVVNE